MVTRAEEKMHKMLYNLGRKYTRHKSLTNNRGRGIKQKNICLHMLHTDFAKAFYSVAHERLLLKLENIGIKGDLLNWIRSFLSGRTTCVNVDGVMSNWRNVLSCIPQGTVLGPILFVIFINDMPEEFKYNMCKLFADDCKLYGPVSTNFNFNSI